MGYYDQHVNFEELVGKRIAEVQGLNVGSDTVKFVMEDGTVYTMYHQQDCCEIVSVEDITGDAADLEGALILYAREDTNSDDPPSEYSESWTWTFYNIQTDKGYVTLRWLGESNGYYSESVEIMME